MSNEESSEIKEEIEKHIEKKKITVFRTSLFNKIYATNFILRTTDVDFRIELLNEKIKIEDEWEYQSDGLVILTRKAAKKLLLSLEEKIQSYEKKHGEIKVDKERFEAQYSI